MPLISCDVQSGLRLESTPVSVAPEFSGKAVPKVFSFPGTDPNPTPSTVINNDDTAPDGVNTTNAMAPGDVFAGRINYLGDHDWIAIDLAAGIPIEITLTGRGNNELLLDTYLSLYSPSGRLLATDDDGGVNFTSQMTFTPTATGTYFIGVSTFDDSETGPYRLSVSEQDAPPPPDDDSSPDGVHTPTAILVGDQIELALDYAGDTDWIAISLTAGEPVQIRMEGYGTDDLDLWNPALTLRDASGTVIASNDDDYSGTRNAEIRLNPAVSGTYFIEARDSHGDEAGSYRVTTQPLTDDYPGEGPDQAHPVTLDSTTMGSIDYMTDSDWFSIELAAGQSVSALLFGDGNDPLADAWMTLRGPDGQVLGSTIDMFGDLSIVAGQSGTYVIEVNGDLEMGGRDYALYLFEEETSDLIEGTNGGDVLAGWGGDDTLLGGRGNDALYGGTGDDVLEGGRDDDVLFGQGGLNTFVFDIDEDGLRRPIGDDTIADFDPFADTLEIGSFLARGLDAAQLVAAAEVIDTGVLLDFGKNGSLLLEGHADTFELALAIRLVPGFIGDSVAVASGTSGRDAFFGSDTPEFFAGKGGDDWIMGGGGNDTLKGGRNADVILGDAGDDLVNGQAGHDHLSGGDGNDTLQGGSKKDWLDGDAGDDRLVGGSHDDTLTGGAGADTFYFDIQHKSGTRAFDHDVITDFDPSADTLLLSAATAGGQDAASIAAAASQTTDGLLLDFGAYGSILLDGVTDRLALQSAIDIA